MNLFKVGATKDKPFFKLEPSWSLKMTCQMNPDMGLLHLLAISQSSFQLSLTFVLLNKHEIKLLYKYL